MEKAESERKRERKRQTEIETEETENKFSSIDSLSKWLEALRLGQVAARS